MELDVLESLDTAIDIWYRRYYHHKYSVSTIHCNCVSILQYMGIYASKSLHERYCMLSLLHHMMYIVFCKNIDVCLYLHKLSLSDLLSDYQRISHGAEECCMKRPPPLREDDPRRVGGARPETTTTTP